MPINTRELKPVSPRPDGSVHVRENLKSSKGRLFTHGPYIAPDQATAEAAMQSRDWTEALQEVEEQEAVDFIERGGDPGVFVKVDLTNAQFNRRLAKRFARARFDMEPDFLRRVATYIAGFTAVQIQNSLGITLVKAQIILDRAIHIRDTIDAALTTDDGRVQEDIE